MPEVQEVPPRFLHSRDEAPRTGPGSSATREPALSGLWDDDDAEDRPRTDLVALLVDADPHAAALGPCYDAEADWRLHSNAATEAGR